MKSITPFIFVFYFLVSSNFCSFLCAQECEVRNVNFEQQDENIVVRYDLNGRFEKKYKVALAVSDDGGITYRIHPKSVSGDIGKNVTPGTHKEITWFLTEDFPDGLEGEYFVFAVEAELQKRGSKLPYYAIGAGVIGGVVYILTKPKTGKIKLHIPGDF